MRRLSITCLVIGDARPASAWAQIPTKGNVFFGYSYDRTSIVSNDTANLNGWEATLEGKLLPWVGLVADVDGHYGSHTYDCPGVGCPLGVNVAAHNVLFGPRVSVQVKRFRPFARVSGGRGAHQPEQRNFRLGYFVCRWCGRRTGLSNRRAGNVPRTARLDQHSLLWPGPEWRAVLDRRRGALLAAHRDSRPRLSTRALARVRFRCRILSWAGLSPRWTARGRLSRTTRLSP